MAALQGQDAVTGLSGCGTACPMSLAKQQSERWGSAKATGSLLVVISIQSLLGTQVFNYTEMCLHGRPWLQASALGGGEAGFLSKGFSGHTVEPVIGTFHLCFFLSFPSTGIYSPPTVCQPLRNGVLTGEELAILCDN